MYDRSLGKSIIICNIGGAPLLFFKKGSRANINLNINVSEVFYFFHFWKMKACIQTMQIIKFPFKRNGLPCCEDEPGSEKIALK